mgnify:CR=1 FL=1
MKIDAPYSEINVLLKMTDVNMTVSSVNNGCFSFYPAKLGALRKLNNKNVLGQL